jgi:Ca2+-transporting ATPase
MGITGTDVAKGAADMTLADDNFATIVDAVKEGRGIYSNIKKVVGFLLGTNIGEILLVLLAMMFLHVSPLLSMQLLLINLVTDSFPAIALGMEPLEKDVMQKPPRPKNEGLFAHGYGWQIVVQGLMFGLLSFFAFIVGVGGFETLSNINALGGFENPIFAENLNNGRTLAFMVLALSQVVQAFNMRSENSLFKIGPFGNKTLNKASLGSVLVMLVVMLIPGLNTVFGLVYLDWYLYLVGIGMSLVPTVLMEIAKATGLIGKK